MNSGPSQSQPARVRFICLILAFITVMVYLPVCFHDFSFLDDVEYVTDNKVVQSGLTWNGVTWAFTSCVSNNWHPLTWLSLMLDCELFGLNPEMHHFVNVLFHASNAVLLFLLCLRLTKGLWPSAFVAGLFAWHPLHVESVAWIAERKDVLSTFWGMFSLWFYVKYAQTKADRETGSTVPALPCRRWTRDYFLAWLFFALGLLAKPMLVTWPFVFLLLDYWPMQRLRRLPFQAALPGVRTTKSSAHSSSRPGLWPLTLEKWPFFLLSAASCLITFLAQRQQAVVSLEVYPLRFRLSNTLISYVNYLWKTVWPVDLALIYPMPGSFPVWRTAGAATVLAIVSLMIWRTRRQRPWLLMSWLWYLGTLVPVIGLVQVGPQALADRYTYVPLIGIFLIVALGSTELAVRFELRSAMTSAAAVLVLGSLLAVTEHQLQYWQNPEVLFNHTLTVTTNNMAAHQVLGAFFYHQGQRDKALAEFREALRIGDSSSQSLAARKESIHAHLVLAGDFEKQGQLDEALAQYRLVLAFAPADAEIHNDLGNLLDKMGKQEEALVHYREAIHLEPEAPTAHNNLGTLLAELGQFEGAMHEYAEASRLKPLDSRPHYLMGKACLRRGQSADAISHFREALRLNPEDFQTLTFLAKVLAADEGEHVRNGQEAVTLAQKANELTENRQPFVLDVLAMAYAETGSFSNAQQTIQKAIGLATDAKQTNMVSAMQQHLKLFQTGQPYREPK